MNIFVEVRDRMDAVADLLGFGDYDEPRNAIRVTRRLRDDRDHGRLALDAFERVAIVALISTIIIVVITQTVLWNSHHPPPVGTYYVEHTDQHYGD